MDGESSSSQVTTLVTTEMYVSEYEETVERISTEMFHIHTKLTAVNKEITKLTVKNVMLNKRNE